jgi:hypothetical protein
MSRNGSVMAFAPCGRIIDAALHLPHSGIMMRSMALSLPACGLAAALICVATSPVHAEDEVATFYKGKTVRMMVGTAPGGGVDLIGRLVARHLRGHIPGNPTSSCRTCRRRQRADVEQYRQYRRPRRHRDRRAAQRHADRTALGAQGGALRPDKLNWIGSVLRSNNVAYAGTAPVRSLEQLKTQDLILGTRTRQRLLDLAFLARHNGPEIQIVRGYESYAVNIAMERGEIQAQTSAGTASRRGRPGSATR